MKYIIISISLSFLFLHFVLNAQDFTWKELGEIKEGRIFVGCLNEIKCNLPWDENCLYLSDIGSSSGWHEISKKSRIVIDKCNKVKFLIVSKHYEDNIRLRLSKPKIKIGKKKIVFSSQLEEYQGTSILLLRSGSLVSDSTINLKKGKYKIYLWKKYIGKLKLP